jgi:hypothetical protein
VIRGFGIIGKPKNGALGLGRRVHHLKGSSGLAELKKSMDGDGDVRIIYSVRRNAVVIETMDFADQTVTEIFRENLVPWLGGFTLPGTE